MRICAEEGATVIPAWFFGTTDMMTVVTDPFGIMEALSRKLQAGLMIVYGRFYLPIPRRIAVTMIVAPYTIPEEIGNPTVQQLEEINSCVYGGLQKQYMRQRAYAGYPHRTLKVT